MNELPSGWARTALGEIAETSLGKMLDRKAGSGRHLKPYLRNVNVQWGRIDESDILTMDIPPEQEERFGLRRGDLLVCEGGEVGRCAIWSGGDSYMGYQKALHRVRPLGGIDSRYLRYLLEHLSLRKIVLAYSTGSTIKHLPQEQLRVLSVPVPPLAEQYRIVAALDDGLSRLDAGLVILEKTEARMAKLRAVLGTAATRAFRADGRSGGTQEGAWDVLPLGNLAIVGTGATPNRSRKDFYESGTIPWVTSGAVNNPFIDSPTDYLTAKALVETSARVWPVGTLLMAMYGEGKTRGKCSELRIEAATNQACAAIVLKPEWQDRKEWVKAVLSAAYEENRKLASGGVQPNLNLGLVSRN
ncbi:restriction endonuclease subunit S [Micromonospora sp. NPDC051296]|uniref:restriction endonuclease subunit S n=1 Tax=Micromonospora sp. NPDC051296 TaxID=3155046 RepID=UPI0034345F77